MEALSRSAWAEIDLDSIAHNARAVSRLVGPSELCAVVKANSYGHEAELVAKTALDNGASWLAVATVEEGVELRDARISTPILLLIEPERQNVEAALKSDLTISVDRPELVWEVAAARERIWGDQREVKIQIHVDTGMYRAGCNLEEAIEIAKLARSAGCSIQGLWSHLAVADNLRDGRSFTFEQLRRFEATRLALAAVGCYPEICHIANSAGATAYPASRYDMVRVGIEIYGYQPSLQVPFPGLRPAFSLKARITHLRNVKAGEAVSYGRKRTLASDSVIATIPIGYADGVPRSLFDGGGEVLVRGERRPVAGVITMDQMMVDLGSDSQIPVGEEVTLIGRQDGEFVGADEWAEKTGTIAYEILARIGPRIPRIFIRGSAGS
ncbi:MAG: alanine racemase [Acidimicrobiaceae bacterium]|nr:alanine racemase [Acidimicrobiaceae bacterium]